MRTSKVLKGGMTALIVVFLSTPAQAQDKGPAAQFWESGNSTCMLFSVSNLTASAYGGGIGIGFLTSPTTLWRLSLSADLSHYETERSYPAQTPYRISLAVSPIMKLRSWNEMYLYMSPSLNIGYDYAGSESAYHYRSGISGTVGVGYSFHEQISLLAEYGVFVTVSHSKGYTHLRAATGGGGMTLVVKL
jgi:hypothetical protein